MLKILYTVAVTALLIGLLPAKDANGDTTGDRPNVLIILVDDMGYGDPQCFNTESKIPTPNIDSLAKSGMRFTDAHAPGPLCHMSRYGLMTGRYPFRINVNKWPKEPLIDEGETTIASLMSDAGYSTAMVGKWHVGFDEQGYDQDLNGGPVDVGFDSFFGIRASTDIPPYFYIRDRRAVTPPTQTIEASQSEGWSPIQGAFWRAGGIAPDLRLHDVLPRFADEACKVIRDHQTATEQKPLMLYVAFPAPHTPWLPDEAYRGKSGADMYGDFTMMVDAMVGRILKQLDESSMSNDTLVIFTSDNGPTWYEADVKRLGHDSSGGLRGMKADAWEAGHRMPFVVRWPGVVKSGTASDRLISFCDLLATLDEMVSAGRVSSESTSQAGPDSFSFLSELTGKPAGDRYPARESLVLKSGRGLMTMRRGQWKYIDGKGSGGFSERDPDAGLADEFPGQLYDLQSDRGETTNVYADRAEVVETLKAEMKAIVQAGRSRN
ncbi:sulfatase family protein [Stieleria varia]|uniref:Arylsulfatase n=1 Tax=Stieleria varia TaxID=2528005 RepID=A0A5C6B5C2_9BACT|nr:arylsulfatase [Stieleria varia]TWU05674.1 Arylsulfatase precursor [Stieleria varia]